MEEKKENVEYEKFDPKLINFNIDMSDNNYQIDVLQNRLLEGYIRADPRFRRAFHTNYTMDFLQFLKDKAKLKEPVHISVVGQVRTFTNNNLIYTNKGWRKPSNIEGCSEVLSWNFDLEKYEWKKFELVKRQKDINEKFYKITFSDGRFIELGENHPIFTATKGWKKAYSLYSNIDIPFFSNYPKQEFKDEISIEKARILAFILSCGHLKHTIKDNYLDKRDNRVYKKESWSISYCNSSKDMVELFRNDMSKEYDLLPNYKKRRNDTYMGIEVEIGSKQVVQELSSDIPIGKKSDIIEIPDSIFNASKEIQKEFIATLFSGDGYIGDCNKHSIVEYYTMSNKFAERLQLILIQYGIISNIYKKKTKSGKFINRVSITNKENILNFFKFVEKLLNKEKDKRLRDTIKHLNKLDKFLKPLKFQIRSKEEINVEGEIYDIFVEDNNNFLLNGILTHNSGKSYSFLAVCIINMALYGKKFTIEYVCADEYEFIQKLQEMPQIKLFNTTFLIDEKKSAVYGVGSTAKKMKAKDVQNIIAINNISTISLTPMKFSNPDAFYGFRLFGRNFNTKTTRSMLYNLQGSKAEIPMGCVYLPIFTKEGFIPKEYAEQLEKDYLQKKNEWVMAEQRGEGDVLGEIKKKSAMNFLKDNQFMELNKKNEKLVYITQKMGSEWTKGEIEEIFYLTKMLERDIDLDFDRDKSNNEKELADEDFKTSKDLDDNDKDEDLD